MKKISILLLLTLFIGYCKGQITNNVKKDIEKSILLNAIHFYNKKMDSDDILKSGEKHFKINHKNIPYFHLFHNFPECQNSIKIEKTENKLMEKTGLFYNYYIQNFSTCFSIKHDTFLSPSEYRSFSVDYDYYDYCGIRFPYNIYRSGTVFIESETNSLYFVSGNLNLTPINTLFDLKKAGTEAWIKMAEIRYANYMPTNINVFNRNKHKRISFYTNYTELENVEFIVEVDKKSYTENMYFINHNQQKKYTLP